MSRGPKPNLKRRKRIAMLYVEQGESLRDIAKRYRVSHEAIRLQLDAEGIQRRPFRRVR